MEFKLNKIDMEIRQRINEETSEGKIHRKTDILIQQNDNRYRDKKDQSRYKKKIKEKFSITKYTTSQKISIDAVKVEDISIDAEKESDLDNPLDNKGIFIDVRK